jgi:hypothetical protein
MQDEMRTHLELYQADLRAQGVPDEEAGGVRWPSSAAWRRAGRNASRIDPVKALRAE